MKEIADCWFWVKIGHMSIPRRQFIANSLTAAAAAVMQSQSRAATVKPGMPGPFPGRVVAVEHPGSIVANTYQAEPVQQMMRKGMQELTGAPSWIDGWRMLFEKGDVVGIKVSPVGGRNLSSDALVLQEILAGLKEAGVPSGDIVVFNRYREETIAAGIDKWLPQGIRWEAASEKYDEWQHDMGGYDADHYMEMALIKPGESFSDVHMRRSYVARVVTKKINKFINLPVLKHHQSAGVTICLKNMSHGMVNNVNRSHVTPTLNACGVFIPSVVSLPVIREKATLHICDAVKASFHGGPGGKAKYIWEHKTMYFATDPVALDKTGLKVIDGKRRQMGMMPLALTKPDEDSHFLNSQTEHIEIAGMLGLGVFEDEKIQVKKFRI
jgi:hypothetical protein